MRKVVVNRPGGYQRLRMEEAPDPVAGVGEVVVRTHAAGVNFADSVVRMGLYPSAKRYVGWPITPGFEFSGTVAQTGPGVDRFREGDEVFGVTRFGGYASHVAVPQDQVFGRPPSLAPTDAAGFCAIHLTAYYAMFRLASVVPGATLLVHSAAGGVGGALLQLGRIAGCRPIGVVGASHKVRVAAERGAEHVIDKSQQPLWSQAERFVPDGYDAIFDANGAETLRGSYRHLATGGRLIVYGFHTMLRRGRGRPDWLKLAVDWLRTPRFNPIDLTNQNRAVLGFNLSTMFQQTHMLREAIEQLLEWHGREELSLPSVTTFPLEHASLAQQAIESGQTTGKLVLLC